ncbi:L-histidine N(alpha)-methyltransferase [Flavobacterium rhizosphaerae]|uniref:L-histidine N(Alpha)-methyltransferase n=1 Tax=Flavobacterium rhizosphaerae TaxID=3163298 RepID=A0ABW8YUF1_9FLAO
MQKTDENQNDKFYKEVVEGLGSPQKYLQPKYFYDKTGDVLFQQIMAMPEYYLTRCELDIFKNKTAGLAKAITAPGGAFDLIELGAGDATKSSYLLEYLVEQQTDFTYMPIDISGNILTVLDENLKAKMPQLDIVCLEGEYFDMLGKAAALSPRRKVVMFLGANIGNMELEEAHNFCHDLYRNLNPGDLLFIGFDLKKHPDTILQAYNDKAGITSKFNLNLLTRINRELGGDFNLEDFEHYQMYDPQTGACKSFLVSLREQEVSIGDKTVHFKKDETVFMEISQKFSEAEIALIAEETGFKALQTFTDDKGWFMDAVWEVV